MRKLRSAVGDLPTDSNLSHESESHTLPTPGLGSLRQSKDTLIRHTELGWCRGPRPRHFSRHQALYYNLEGRRKVSTCSRPRGQGIYLWTNRFLGLGCEDWPKRDKDQRWKKAFPKFRGAPPWLPGPRLRGKPHISNPGLQDLGIWSRQQRGGCSPNSGWRLGSDGLRPRGSRPCPSIPASCLSCQVLAPSQLQPKDWFRTVRTSQPLSQRAKGPWGRRLWPLTLGPAGTWPGRRRKEGGGWRDHSPQETGQTWKHNCRGFCSRVSFLSFCSSPHPQYFSKSKQAEGGVEMSLYDFDLAATN